MRSKFWKILGISAALLAILALLFVVAFIFNPFEGSLPDIRELVPRDADYYVRKVELKDDFATYNRIWAEFFADDPPCRTTVEINALPTPIAIELKCIATIE